LQAEPAIHTALQEAKGNGKWERGQGNRGQWHLDKGPGGAWNRVGLPFAPTHKNSQKLVTLTFASVCECLSLYG